MTLDARLRERYFGDLEGKSGAQEYRTVWEFDARHQIFANVESPENVYRRAIAVVKEEQKENENDLTFIVSHGDTLQILQAGFIGEKDGSESGVIAAWGHRNIKHLETGEIRQLNNAG
ncbi:hypothetical protein HK100_002253 [Physocladia obscura]|uniref:Phosphoglycerate mutase n=1 Tax=Physocladia obscura TaxID=109957 RepID=A0AAD5XH76_9FUNG|nr:hypothetical protein HK100_002253 [Physocladia obscura]